MVMGGLSGGFEGRVDTTIGPKPVQVEKGDFNKDGNLDLAILSVGVAGKHGNVLYVLEGDGTGGFESTFINVIQTSDYLSAFTVGDFNGDSWPDLALMEPGLTRVRIVINDKETDDFTFHEEVQPLSVDMGGVTLSAGDFTGNGNSDLAVAFASEFAGTVKLLVSSGDGAFTSGASVELNFPPTCMALDTMNADDTLDIALGGGEFGAGKAAILFGDGSGNLAAPIVNDSLSDAPVDIAAGDLNNDDLKDLVFVLTEDYLLVTVQLLPVSSGNEFVRGDANGDELIDLSDAIGALLYLFKAGETDCLESLDVNNDRKIDLSDPIYLLTYLFVGGEAPSAPYPGAGVDPDPESLGCER